MAFTFHIRGISNQKIKKLHKKYTKLFKKTHDPTIIICALFLEINYFYFDNDQEKLFKFFFPVIMTNFVEKGSIHSVINEYRISHNLYSWSYTYRILEQLDDDVGLEIGKLFRKLLFKILKKNGFKNKGYCVAIDITDKPFYGNKNLLMVKGTKRKAGTNYAIQYLSASIIEEGVRFNLLCFPINSLTLISRKFKHLIQEIRKMIPIKLLFLDRGFGNKKYCKILKALRHKFIMPITRNNKLKELELCIKEQSDAQDEEYDIVKINYVFSENRSKEYQVRIKLIILHHKDTAVFFITNLFKLNHEEYYSLTKVYKYRFGIETNYRVDNIFSAFTCSIKSCLRYLLMHMSLIAQDLWTLVNFLMHKENKKQPREKYKKTHSIMDVIRARIRKLDFIWRPIIPTVQFKRRVNKILG